MSVSEVAAITGLSRATAKRLLHTLEAGGYALSIGGRYFLKPHTLGLGYAALVPRGLVGIVEMELVELSERTGVTCSAGVLTGSEVSFIARAAVATPHLIAIATLVGNRMPAHLSAIGRVLLAEMEDDDISTRFAGVEFRPATPHAVVDLSDLHRRLDQVRADGYCLVDQEVEQGVFAAAVRVHPRDRPALGISMTLHVSHASILEVRSRLVPEMQATAAILENILPLRLDRTPAR